MTKNTKIANRISTSIEWEWNIKKQEENATQKKIMSFSLNIPENREGFITLGDVGKAEKRCVFCVCGQKECA